MIEWVKSHKTASWVTAAVVALFVIGAIGSASEEKKRPAAKSPSEAKGESSVERKVEERTPAKEAKEKESEKADSVAAYRQSVAECAEEVLYSTRDAGNALRIESSTGRRILANVQVFESEREANKFEDQLDVPGESGGKGVAIWLKDAEPRDMRIISDCLTP